MKDYNKLLAQRFNILILALSLALGLFLGKPKDVAAAKRNPLTRVLALEQETMRTANQLHHLHENVQEFTLALQLITEAKDLMGKYTLLNSVTSLSELDADSYSYVLGFEHGIKYKIDLAYFILKRLEKKGIGKFLEPLLQELLGLDELILDSMVKGVHVHLSEKRPFMAQICLRIAKATLINVDFTNKPFKTLFRDYQKLHTKVHLTIKRIRGLEKRQREIYLKAVTMGLDTTNGWGDRVRMLSGAIKKLEGLKRQLEKIYIPQVSKGPRPIELSDPNPDSTGQETATFREMISHLKALMAELQQRK